MTSHVELMSSLRSVVPALRGGLHKGQAGRVGVVGGSAEYTGAPYLCAMAALRVGADLAHVLCTRDASVPIKCYSPELIVHPVLDGEAAGRCMAELGPRLGAVVLGPGLGRAPAALEAAGRLIEQLRQLDVPLVVDADALWLLQERPQLVHGYHRCVLTPNAAEFSRLYRTLLQRELPAGPQLESEHVQAVSRQLGGVTVVRKGREDLVATGDAVAVCAEPGSGRRCGGQGDLLAGAVATLLHWTLTTNQPLAVEPPLLAAYGACVLSRRANRLTFSTHGRGMLASDMLNNVHQAFQQLFEAT